MVPVLGEVALYKLQPHQMWPIYRCAVFTTIWNVEIGDWWQVKEKIKQTKRAANSMEIHVTISWIPNLQQYDQN